MINKKTVDLESSPTQWKEYETDISSANVGTHASSNEDEIATNDNLIHRSKAWLNSSKNYYVCCVNRYFNNKNYKNVGHWGK